MLFPDFSLEHPGNSLCEAIAAAIKRTYPVGVSSESPEYRNHAGMQQFEKLMEETIVNRKGKIAAAWRSVVQELTRQSGLAMHGTTYGYVPGLSADLILDEYQDQALIRIKRIAFAVSLVGPFYNICEVDETFIKDDGKKYHAINVVTVSPYKEFEQEFLRIKTVIETYFSGYSFVPFLTAMRFLEDVQVFHNNREESTIYNALFNYLFNDYKNKLPRGESGYGFVRNPNISVVLRPPPPQE